jgi:uncharacterized protein YlzI (FlbEa/FlbD family)
MTEIKIETIESNFDSIQEMVGSNSYVNWEKFSSSSAEVINSIDELNKKVSIFR